MTGSEWFKLNERLVSPCYKIATRHVSFAWLTSSFLALSACCHLIHLPSSPKYQLHFQKLANLGLQLLPQVLYPLSSLAYTYWLWKLAWNTQQHGNAKQRKYRKQNRWFQGVNCKFECKKTICTKLNEILGRFDYVLSRSDNERSCPMGYRVPRRINCHSACCLVAFYLCSGHYIS